MDLETGEYRVLIEQGTRGEPGTSTIWGPEIITLDEDTTITTRVDFSSEPTGDQPQCFLPEGCFLSGDVSNEKIVGGIGPDHIIGGGGNDTLHGLDNDDCLDGGAGDDLVRGEAGNDALYGGAGNDFVYAADGEFDEVSGGSRYDVCVVDEEDDVTGCEEVYTQ